VTARSESAGTVAARPWPGGPTVLAGPGPGDGDRFEPDHIPSQPNHDRIVRPPLSSLSSESETPAGGDRGSEARPGATSPARQPGGVRGVTDPGLRVPGRRAAPTRTVRRY
jgi:hypothetical protein